MENKKIKKTRKGKRKKIKSLIKPNMSAEEKAEIRMIEKLPEPLNIKYLQIIHLMLRVEPLQPLLDPLRVK